jgi:two-component system chemotaxis sensor kinase CheA
VNPYDFRVQNTLALGLTEVVYVKVEPIEVADRALVNTTSEAQERTVQDEQSPAAKSKQSPTIRVNVERLEHMMKPGCELVNDRTRIHQVERALSRRFSDESVNELRQISDHLSRIIGELQESVMKARMLPIEQLFNRFPRMIRDLSRDLGKEIELAIEGKDTELDRTLIEEIADPLIHLIRNAVDHGIEMPEKRQQSDKLPKGRLSIRAADEYNQVVLYVENDGAGIDPNKMKKSALNKGVITAEEAEQLSDSEAIQLIFRPGFSTAAVVSDVSGRGVGMDIVRSHIEKLNGLIDIETKLGQGTQFKIKLPLTLAIIVGLLVKLNEQTLIIPMSNIAGSAEKRLALAVDELIGNQEIVIKSLGSYVGKVHSIAGSTILGDGNKIGGNHI